MKAPLALVLAATAACSALAGTVASLAASSSPAESARGPSNAAHGKDGLLAFERFSGREQRGYPVATYVVRTDGTGLRRLTTPCGECWSSPRWSPDGSKIALIDGWPTRRIVVMKPDGSGRRRLGVEATRLAWSPDGRQIAFTAHRRGLAIVNADGSRLRRIPRTRWIQWPDDLDWSPDGTQFIVAYVDRGLFLVSRDGSGSRSIPGRGLSARWSPDGRELLIVRGGRHAVYAMTPSTGARRLIRELPAVGVGSVSISSDGNSLAYSVFYRGLYILDLESGRTRKVRLRQSVCTGRWGCSRVDWQTTR